MMLVAATGESRRSLEQGPRSLEDVSAALEAHLVALETMPPAVQLILDEIDRKAAEAQLLGQADTPATSATDYQKRPNSSTEDASPSKKLRGLALGPTEIKEQRAASEERPNGDSGEPPATAAKLRAAATAAAATAAAAKAQKPPQRAPRTVAALIVPASPTSPVPIAPADSTADSTATTTAVESAAQTAAALAAAPHPDV
jgi:hypothetical protein